MAGSRGRLLALACATLAVTLLLVGAAGATDIGTLQAKVSAGREEAGSLTSQLQAAQGELAAAQEEADAASAREAKLTGLLATGEERAARLANDVRLTQRHLAAEKRRLHRARTALSERRLFGGPDLPFPARPSGPRPPGRAYCAVVYLVTRIPILVALVQYLHSTPGLTLSEVALRRDGGW